VITPVLMSGGAGTRLWPLSRKARPKQFHALGGDKTLIQQTALRVTGGLFGSPMVVCNVAHAELVREQLAAVGVLPRTLILEPEGRNTGPAAAVAAAVAGQDEPDGLVLLIHADNLVADVAALHRAIEAGAAAAQAGSLVIFGITPTGPETGYGYIRAGTGDGPARKVAQFVEKPDLETAKACIADPAYSWNAGMFLFRPDVFLAEVRRLAPELAAAADVSVDQAIRDDSAVRLGPAFLRSPAVAIDTAVFELTEKAVVVQADIGWSDVGNYDALWAGGDGPGSNAFSGPVIAAGAEGCLVMSDGPTVVISGVDDLAVVVEDGVVLVTRRSDPGAVRAAVDAIKTAGRDDLL
jgi:mannose-1-phosphate guanylyltransferase/mannose-6-phosphate isomerase